MVRKVCVYGSLGGIVLFIDQYTKYLVLKNMGLGESISVIHNFFSITYIRNYGAVFGFLNNSETDWQFWLFMGAILFACVFVFYTLWSNKNNDILWIACSLLLAGGFGNTIDRIRYRYVIDFFDFFIGNYHWPAFNLADCYIIIAIILLLFEPYLTKILKKTVE